VVTAAPSVRENSSNEPDRKRKYQNFLKLQVLLQGKINKILTFFAGTGEWLSAV
jgi:hypothetical protein